MARHVPSVGYALDAVVGEGLKSIQGGIGVENLQGSGLIAGETSRAQLAQERFRYDFAQVPRDLHLILRDWPIGGHRCLSEPLGSARDSVGGWTLGAHGLQRFEQAAGQECRLARQRRSQRFMFHVNCGARRKDRRDEDSRM